MQYMNNNLTPDVSMQFCKAAHSEIEAQYKDDLVHFV